MLRRNGVLIALLFGAFLFAIVGITYGLPLHIVPDEESLVGGALTMLQERTIIPALKPEAFNLLYYPVVIPYAILIFSVPVLIVQLALHGGSLIATQDYLVMHQEYLWLAARCVSVASFIALLFVLFRIAEALFNRRTGHLAVLLTATSFYVINMSHWIKHWMPAIFISYLMLYYCIRYVHGHSKRSFLPGVIAGIGFGVSYVTAFGNLVTALYVLSQRKMLATRFWKFVLISACAFTIVAALLTVANYSQFIDHFLSGGDVTHSARTVMGWLSLLSISAYLLIIHEPVIFIGSLLSCMFNRTYFKMHSFIFGGVLVYLSCLYVFFHFEPRYLAFIVPALALSAAAGMHSFIARARWRIFGIVIITVAVLYASVFIIRYDMLLIASDTRTLAQEWIVREIGSSEFVMSSPSMLMKRSRKALEREQRYGRIRAAERYSLLHYDRIHGGTENGLNYTNIHFWKLNATPDELHAYSSEFHPRYFVLETWDADDLSVLDKDLISRGTLVRTFKQSSNAVSYDINGNFFAPLIMLFTLDRPGPEINIYSLK